MRIVAQAEVVAAAQQALAEERHGDVAILVAVDHAHAIVARGAKEGKEKQPSTALKAMERVWPALAAVCGGEDVAATALARMRPLSKATRTFRRRLVRHARVSAMQQYAHQLTLALVLNAALTFQPKSQFQMLVRAATHAVSVDDSSISFERSRAVVGLDSVHGPAVKLHAFEHFQDMLNLELGQPFERIPLEQRSEPSEGTSRVRNLRKVLAEQLQWLFDTGSIKADAAGSFTAFFRMGGDFGNVVRWTINKVPYLVTSVALLFDPAVFEAEASRSVCRSLIVVLARERDEIASVQFYAPLILEQLSTLQTSVLVRDHSSVVRHTIHAQATYRFRCSWLTSCSVRAVAGACERRSVQHDGLRQCNGQASFP